MAKRVHEVGSLLAWRRPVASPDVRFARSSATLHVRYTWGGRDQTELFFDPVQGPLLQAIRDGLLTNPGRIAEPDAETGWTSWPGLGTADVGAGRAATFDAEVLLRYAHSYAPLPIRIPRPIWAQIVAAVRGGEADDLKVH